MAIIRRAQWGAPAASRAAFIGSTRGVKVHYLGTAYSSRPHTQCPAYVRQILQSHLANKEENYVDIAYNFLVCEHGGVFEGRGVHRRTGANGTAELNSRDYAVCALLGSSGLTEPTDAMLHGIRDAIEELREHGDAGDWIGGHRDGHATTCPGDPLYAWVKRGAPRPGKPAPSRPTAPAVQYAPFPGAAFFRDRPTSPLITAMGRRLVAEGCGRYKVGPGPRWSEADRQSYAAWQRKLGYRGDDADGWPGKTSWDRLRVPKTSK